MVERFHKQAQFVRALILQPEIQIALSDPRGPLRQSENRSRKFLGQPESEPDRSENGDHTQYAENEQKGNLERLLELLELSVFLEPVGNLFQFGEQALSDALGRVGLRR